MKDLQNPIAALLIPAAQAMISGLLVGIISAALGGDGLAWGAVAALLAWLVLITRWGDLIREIVHPSPDPGQAAEMTLKIAVLEEQGRAGMFAELRGFSLEQLAILAKGLEAGETMNEAAWTGPGKPFSRSQFYELRQVFLSRGWARWRSSTTPARGIELSRPGQAVMRYLSDLEIAGPLLDQERTQKPR